MAVRLAVTVLGNGSVVTGVKGATGDRVSEATIVSGDRDLADDQRREREAFSLPGEGAGHCVANRRRATLGLRIRQSSD